LVATSLVTNLILTSPQAQGRSRWDKCEKGEKKMSKLGRIVLVSMVVLLVLTTLVGWVTRLVVGKRMVALGEDMIKRVPLLNKTYGFMKEISQTMLAGKRTMFQRALTG